MTYALDELLRQLADQSVLHWSEETYDLGLAGGLDGAERATFVAKLCENARVGDTRAILTLGHLQVVEALPMLRADATSGVPWGLAARRALVILGCGAEVVERIAADALHAPAKMARVAAVLDLPKVGGALATATLEQALSDEDDAVRALAWNGLVEVLDLDRHIRGPDGNRDASTELERLDALLSSDLATLVRLGADGVREIARRLRAGATPRSLGIAWEPGPEPAVFSTLRLALFEPDAEFPVADIDLLTGVHRRWAETIIALRVEQHDPRAPEALVRLAASWAAPALAEVADSPDTPPDLRDQLTRSAATLQGS